MRSYEFISESLDYPYTSRKSRPKHYLTIARYVFQTEPTRKKYSINFYHTHPNGVIVEFDRQTPEGSTIKKTKDSHKEVLRIFATVKDVLKKVIEDFPQTDTIYFKGEIEEGETLKDSNRISLYRMLANKIQTELKWKSVTERSTSDAVMWTIRKSDAPVIDEPAPTQDTPSSKNKKK